MIPKLRWFLSVEAAAFILASLIHFGLLVSGYEHSRARIAEAVIAAVLIAGLLWSLLSPASTRIAAILAQGFALLGTFVGVFTIIVGVGPRTVPDGIYHVVIIAVLAWGLVTAWSADSMVEGSVR